MKTTKTILSVAVAIVAICSALFLALGVASPALSTAPFAAQVAPTVTPMPSAGGAIPIKPLTDLTSLEATVKLDVNGLINGKRAQGQLTMLLATNNQGKSKATISGPLLGDIVAQVGGAAVALFTPSAVDVYKVPQGTYIVVDGLFPICVKPKAADATKSFDDLSPQGLLTLLTDSDVARGTLVGDESLNGVAVKHYVIDGPTFLTAAQNSSNPKLREFGEALWVAQDADLYVDATGGIPVAFRGGYSGAYAPLKFEGQFGVQTELTGVNTNPRIDLPASCNNPISR
ncbi:MAG: hypothetical protein KIS91_08910 [Anaerolineae bacterium]|nr:hypothetical protein [Anaerolineae bacterium]